MYLFLFARNLVKTTKRRIQGRNEGEARGTIPRVPNHYGGVESLRGASNDCGGHRKAPTLSQVLSTIPYICFLKTSNSNMGAPNFLPRAPSNLVTPLVGSNTDNIVFHRSFAVPGGLGLLRAFCQWKIEHQLRTVFFFFIFFCNRFYTDGLNLSHAQVHNIVVLLLY